MRTIYIDADYICHPNDGEGRTAIKTDALDNVCAEALEFYKFIPAHDGKVDLIQCINSKTSTAVQIAVDRTQAEADAELAALIEEIYQNDLEMMEE